MSCKYCNKIINNRDLLTCSVCKKKCHAECANVSIKRLLLMTSENKKNWRCTNCIKTQNKNNPERESPLTGKIPTTNVTLRKKPVSNTPSLSIADSIDTIIDTTVHTGDSLINRSCPENNTHNWEEIEDLKSKIATLETKLESADNEIERLLTENYALKKLVSKRDAKINNLTRIYQSTPTSSNKRLTTPSGKGDGVKITPVKRATSLNEKSSPSSLSLQDMETSLDNLNAKMSAKSAESPSKPKPQKMQKEKTNAVPQQLQHTHKICLISTNMYNKTTSIALNNFQGDVCHYLMPDRGLKQLIEGIDNKLKNFTKNDHCIILIGEEDFNTTTDYYELITHLRETLKKIDYTNILICLPTYKVSKYVDLFNWRVEIFNNLLYFDIMTHEYAFLIDSNKNLKYNKSMFHQRHGTLNNYGLNVIFRFVHKKIQLINKWNLGENNCTMKVLGEKDDRPEAIHIPNAGKCFRRHSV